MGIKVQKSMLEYVPTIEHGDGKVAVLPIKWVLAQSMFTRVLKDNIQLEISSLKG